MSRREGRSVLPVLFRRRRVQKTLEIRLANGRLARRHVVQSALLHPSLQLAYQFKQVVERIDDKEQRLIVVDLKVLVDDPLELNGVSLYLGRVDRIRNLSV